MIPSDYAGITRQSYNGMWATSQVISAVSPACSVIEAQIKSPIDPSPYAAYAGQWKSKYAAGPDISHRQVIDDVDITVEGDELTLESSTAPGLFAYKGRGKIHFKNQVVGQWNHPENQSLAEGLFLLTVSPTADWMYGYSTSRDAEGAMIYGTWVFAKKNGRTEEEVLAGLTTAQNILKTRTIEPTGIVMVAPLHNQ